MNRLSDEIGYKRIQDKDKHKLRNMKSEEIIKDLGIPIAKLPIVTEMAKSELNREVGSVKPVRGIKETLLKLKKDGYKLGILTSNAKDTVEKFLRRNNLMVFDFIYSTSTLGKAGEFKNLLGKEKLKAENVFYVGDETRDIEAAKEMGIKSVAVAWGVNSRQVLKKQAPDFLINKPEELLAALYDNERR